MVYIFYQGGESQEGKIQEVVTWAGKYHRGGVRVQWQTDSSVKEYRVGGEGCVDVIYIRKESVTSGGKYYPDHLPVVGKTFHIYIRHTVIRYPNCNTMNSFCDV